MATELITWGEKYCLGLDEIDEQHQALVDIINRIWQSIILRSDKQAIFSLIAELEKYTLAHFAAEESLMRITDYPRFEKHKQEHQDFIGRVAKEKAHAMAAGSLSLDIIYFLRDWLLEHILASDKHYAAYTHRVKTERESLITRLFRRLF